MLKIVGALPVKTRLPFEVWVLAGLVTLFSLVTSFTQHGSRILQAAKPEPALFASMTDLRILFGAHPSSVKSKRFALVVTALNSLDGPGRREAAGHPSMCSNVTKQSTLPRLAAASSSTPLRRRN
jgi:hypothetical protein